MDLGLQMIADYMKVFGGGAAKDPRMEKERMMLQLQAQCDSRVWDKIAADVREKLSMATTPEALKSTFDELMTKVKDEQAQADDADRTRAFYTDQATFSPQVQQLLQAQPQP